MNYFFRDHLGSVRVIVDGCGVVKERNDYYPFGARHVRGDYPLLATNRLKYNGKEEQVTGDLKFLDHGARMYDSGLGRWFGMDPMAESYLSQSPYHFCGNNPIMFVDPNGMDYWATSDPSLIAGFLNSLRNGVGVHDFSGWDYATNADFTGNLTYDDEKHKYYTFVSLIRDGEVVVIGRSFDAWVLPVVDLLPYEGAFVREPLSGFWQNLGYYTGIGGYDKYPGIVGEWNVSREGRLTGIKPIELVVPDLGIGKGGLLKTAKGGIQGVKSLGAATKGFSKNVIPAGFKEVKKFGYKHGQKVYEYKGKYYSKDVDGHNGGVWKVFESVGGKLKRIGTADENLVIFKN